jgi:hypothetical protein
LKSLNQNTQWRAGCAAIAIGAVGEHAASSEAAVHQVGISGVVDQVAGCSHLGPRLAVRQVAAGIRRRGIKLQGLKR